MDFSIVSERDGSIIYYVKEKVCGIFPVNAFRVSTGQVFTVGHRKDDRDSYIIKKHSIMTFINSNESN